jgi:hypothetical protein
MPGLHSNSSSPARRSIWHPRRTDASYTQDVQPPDEFFADIGNEYSNFQWAPPQCQCQENWLQDGEGFPIHHLQHVALVQLPFGPSIGDFGPGNSHVRLSVSGHEAWFVIDPGLGSARCLTVGHPSVCLSVISRLPFGPFCQFPCVSWRTFVSFPTPVVIFSLSPIGAVTPEVAWLPTDQARWSSVVSWCGWDATAHPEYPCTHVPEAGGRPSSYICCLQLESLIKGLA